MSVGHFMGEEGPGVNGTKLGITMFLITAVPVGLGMLVTARSPDFVTRWAPAIARVALGLFVLVVLAALGKIWTVFAGNLGTLGPAAILLNLILLAAGLATAKLIRLQQADASTISIESGVQNGTLAIAVGSLIAITGEETLPPTTVPAVVYSITMYLVCIPFVLWRRRGNSSA